MVGTLVMAPKSVTFRRHDHLVSVLFGDLLSHSYNITFSMFLYLVQYCLWGKNYLWPSETVKYCQHLYKGELDSECMEVLLEYTSTYLYMGVPTFCTCVYCVCELLFVCFLFVFCGLWSCYFFCFVCLLRNQHA